jgi:hypothetical protein
MSTATRGLAAGLIAAAVLALLILVAGGIRDFPGIDVTRLIGAAASELFGMPRTAAVGWVLFFVIGAVWGLVFAWIFHRLPGRSGLVRGLVFAVAVWVVMMIVFMPIAGAGWFGLALGGPAPVATFLMHLIFGAVMGVCFAALPAHGAPVREGRRE